MVAPTVSGYSSNVRMELLAGTQRFFPSQIAAGRITFDREVLLPGTEGELILFIDEHSRRWHLTWEASDKPRRTWLTKYRDVEYMHSGGATMDTNG